MAIHTLVLDTILEPYKTVMRDSGKPLEMDSPVDNVVLFTGMGTHHKEHPSLEDMRENGGLKANDTVCFATEHMQQGLQAWSDASPCTSRPTAQPVKV